MGSPEWNDVLASRNSLLSSHLLGSRTGHQVSRQPGGLWVPDSWGIWWAFPVELGWHSAPKRRDGGHAHADPSPGLFCLEGCCSPPPVCAWVLSHFSCVHLFVTLWTVAQQAPLSTGFHSQEYWNGLPCPPPGDLPDPRIEPESPASPALQVDSLPLSHREAHPPHTQPEYDLKNFKEGAQKCRDLLSGRARGTGFLLAYFPVNWQWGRKDGLFEDFFFITDTPTICPKSILSIFSLFDIAFPFTNPEGLSFEHSSLFLQALLSPCCARKQDISTAFKLSDCWDQVSAIYLLCYP